MHVQPTALLDVELEIRVLQMVPSVPRHNDGGTNKYTT